MHAWKHFCTINHHKRLVMKECFALGLYWQGLVHDLSKYSITEFRVGAKYYTGTYSPNNKERVETGMSLAWLHHKGRNKHHYEYWIDYAMPKGKGLTGMKMPVKYVCEMFCDRIAASKTYQKEAYSDQSPLNYYMKGVGHYVIHPETNELLLDMLTILAEQGEKEAFYYIRTKVLGKKK